MLQDCEKFRMPFGKYEGLTLLEISESDEGLRYLDWLLGCGLRPSTQEIIEEFVELPHIAREIDRVTG